MTQHGALPFGVPPLWSPSSSCLCGAQCLPSKEGRFAEVQGQQQSRPGAHAHAPVLQAAADLPQRRESRGDRPAPWGLWVLYEEQGAVEATASAETVLPGGCWGGMARRSLLKG